MPNNQDICIPDSIEENFSSVSTTADVLMREGAEASLHMSDTHLHMNDTPLLMNDILLERGSAASMLMKDVLLRNRMMRKNSAVRDTLPEHGALMHRLGMPSGAPLADLYDCKSIMRAQTQTPREATLSSRGHCQLTDVNLSASGASPNVVVLPGVDAVSGVMPWRNKESLLSNKVMSESESHSRREDGASLARGLAAYGVAGLDKSNGGVVSGLERTNIIGNLIMEIRASNTHVHKNQAVDYSAVHARTLAGDFSESAKLLHHLQARVTLEGAHVQHIPRGEDSSSSSNSSSSASRANECTGPISGGWDRRNGNAGMFERNGSISMFERNANFLMGERNGNLNGGVRNEILGVREFAGASSVCSLARGSVVRGTPNGVGADGRDAENDVMSIHTLICS
jgi:hypothetical protein